MRTISAIAALMFIAGSCLAFKPGSTGYSATWLSVLGASGITGPTNYLHFWDPAGTLTSDDQADGLDFTGVSGLTTSSTEGWLFPASDNLRYAEVDGGGNVTLTNGGTFTFTAWIKPDVAAMNAQTIGGYIICDREGSLDFMVLHASGVSTYQGPSLLFNLYPTGGEIRLYDDTYISNVWNHIAVVVDQSSQTAYFYVNGNHAEYNGTARSPSSFSGSVRDGSTKTRIGIDSRSTQQQTQFHGSIGKVRFYQRALTQAEIQAEIDSDGGTGP